MARPIRVVTRLSGGIALALLLGSLVLAWLAVRSGAGGDGFEIAAFIIYPLLAMVIASIAASLLLLLGFLLEGALRLSGGRALWLVALVPLAVVPVVGLALWPWTLGPPRAAALCRDEGGFAGAPLPVAPSRRPRSRPRATAISRGSSAPCSNPWTTARPAAGSASSARRCVPTSGC